MHRPTHRSNTTRPPGFRSHLALVLLAAPCLVAARPDPAPGPVRFDRLGAESGLSAGHVTSILQDRTGFLWVGTTDGLNRYDGHSVAVFRHDPLDPTSIRGNWISGLREDPDGALWIGLGIGGMDRFDPEHERFEHHVAIAGGNGAPGAPAFTAFHRDGTGRVWVGSTHGLARLVRDGGDARFVAHPLGAPGEPAHVRALAETPDGTLWIGTATHGLLTEPPRPDGPILSDRDVRTLRVDRTGRLWIGTDRGLVRLDAAPAPGSSLAGVEVFRGRQIVHLLEDRTGAVWVVTAGGAIARLEPGEDAFRLVPLPEHIARNGGTSIRRLLCDEEGRVWLASGKGLLVWSPSARVLHVYGHDPTDPASLPHDMITALFEDRAGMLWVGTQGGGLASLDERSMRFHRHRNPIADPATPSASSIHALVVDRRDRLWLGTANGLYGIETLGEAEGATPIADGHGPHPLRTPILALCEDTDGRLWIGHQQGVTVRTDRPDGEPDYVHVATPPLRNVAVRSIVERRTGGMWLGTSSGLVRLDADGTAHRYPVARDAADALPSTLVSALHEEADGTLWVGTYIGGLSRLDPHTDTFVHFLPDDGGVTPVSAINSQSVTDIAEDRTGRLWIGTYSGGLNLLDRETGRFAHVTSADGPVGSRIAGILEDDAGRLWLSTNAGLSRFDPETRAVKSYDVDDGLQGNEFHVGARHRTREGVLLFGGVNGFNAFHPEEIADNLVPPKVAITAFRVMDRPGHIADYRGADHDIRLEHDQSFVAFEFAALDFTNPKRNRYAYRMEGIDPGWVDAGTRRYAAYTDLDPGSYVFRVKGSNNDGIWNEAALALTIRVVPPFYRTHWFAALTIVAIAALALGTHHALTRRRVAQSLALERVRTAERERVREEVSRDYHDELGARLTKISLFTELIRRRSGDGGGDGRGDDTSDNDVTTYVEKVAQSAEILARESRDFIWALNPSKDLLVDVAHYLQEFGADLFDRTPVMFHVDGLSPRLDAVRLDTQWKRQITLIFKEALTNVLRHANATHATLIFALEPTALVISLVDDGQGLAEVTAEADGSGLANMRTRAAEIGATLTVTHERAPGTTVTFRAPLPAEAGRT